jgi:hypothetical protein
MKSLPYYRKAVSLCLHIIITAVLGFPINALAEQAGTSPVKIFILAGQSNMQGQGEISPATRQGTLGYTVANDPNGDYQFLIDPNGNWLFWDDVWMHYERGSNQLRTGSLTAGYGASNSNTTIGPELGFGNVMGEYFDNQVLIVKAAWGGKSLYIDFRPPSSGRNVGFYYNEILRLVEDAVTNLATYFPDYDGQGYEIAGFGWHQGWNDRVDQASVNEYEFNMANFIRDIRADLGVPNLPFVIATTGMTGWTETNARALALMEAQLAVAEYPEFKGNVFTVETRPFWRAANQSPADQGYHWNRNAETYLKIGLAMGEAMKDIINRHLGSGTILREWWMGVDGTSVADLNLSPGYPGLPDSTEELTLFQTPTDWADAYGARIRGYVYPPVTGEYTFWIASHDDSQLWLNTDPNTGPAFASMIASVSGGTDPCSWDQSPSQQSLPLFLEAGRGFYIEAVHKAGQGADHLAVAWEGPDITRTIIDGQFLSPWVGAGPPALTVENTDSQNVETRSATLTGQVFPEDGDNPAVWIYWGPNDAGMNQADWEHVESLEPQSETFSAGISGLDPNTTYYFRCFAADSDSYDWADSSAEFTSLPASPFVENINASNTSRGHAMLTGQVTYVGEEIPNVIIYWGDNDGTIVAEEWDHYEDLGQQSGQFSTTISGLVSGKIYYFRCYAFNSFGGAWASSSFVFRPR